MKYFKIILEDIKSLKTNKLFSELNRKIQKPLKQMMPPNYFRRHKIIDANIMCQN